MQAKRVTGTKGKSAGATPAPRKNPARRVRTQPGSTRSLHTQPRTDVSTIRDNSAPALKVSLNGRISSFVDLVTLPKGTAVLDSRQKYIKAAEDLYSIARLMEGFKDNERWSGRTTPEDVFHTLYGKLMQTYRNCDSVKLELLAGTYCLTMQQPIYFDEPYPSIAVYWIAEMEKVSREIFDLCCYLVSMVHGMGIQFWQDENDNFMFDEINQSLSYKLTGRRATGEDDAEIEELQRCQVEYSEKGVASKFLKRLNRGSSKKIWLKSYNMFLQSRKAIKGSVNTPLMKDLLQWLEIGKQLIKANDNINRYISLPEEYSGLEEQYDELPGTPDQFVLFLWKHGDWWYETHIDFLQSIEQNQGGLPYYKKTILKTKADLKPDKTSFPELMLEFFYTGRRFEAKHRKAFASTNALQKALYKPGLLLDILL